jgi:hypothetical protein
VLTRTSGCSCAKPSAKSKRPEEKRPKDLFIGVYLRASAAR